MAVARSLKRLLHVLELEEEQRQIALQAALGELHRLERAIDAAGVRERGGRQLITASARSGELEDRLAGLEEARAGLRIRDVLTPRAADAAHVALERREEFLAKRIERRQAETLIESAEAQAELEASRRRQGALDEWFLNRREAKDSLSDNPEQKQK
jgi:hypothetical protein